MDAWSYLQQRFHTAAMNAGKSCIANIVAIIVTF